MKILLPNSAFLGNIEGFLRKFDPVDPSILDVTFNERWVSVHPFVLAMVASLGQTLIDEGHSINGEVPLVRSLPYLIRMGLLERLDLQSPTIINQHESAGRFIPLTQIRNSQDLHSFITDMIPLLHAGPHEADPIKYVVSELVRNVIEHSNSPVGAFICAQYFKDKQRVSIGIADTGIGIKRSMTHNHIAESHLDAILLALRPGITGTTKRIGGTEANAGAGLFFTRNIAKASQNYFVI